MLKRISKIHLPDGRNWKRYNRILMLGHAFYYDGKCFYMIRVLRILYKVSTIYTTKLCLLILFHVEIASIKP